MITVFSLFAVAIFSISNQLSPVSASESHREKGIARLTYLGYILENIVSDRTLRDNP